ncbi:MAG: phage tail sheath subtilisin-like domain-containing protein, partial [Rhodobacter sp.]|nr:phage tail sheath subtilisin-like domain-containing protein [Rhodobacter sp.]
MALDFLHGIELIEIDGGLRPIQTVRSSVIGLVGTAPDADAEAFPLDTPVLVAGNRLEAAKLDTAGDGNGTLPAAIDGIFDQAGALVVVVRVEEGVDDTATQANVIGGVSGLDDSYEGMHAFLAAENATGVIPRVLIAPGFSQAAAVAAELDTLTARLRAVAIVDGPNTTDADAIAFRGTLGSDRLYLVDPWVTVGVDNSVEPPSARVAGVIARIDAERGFWWSPSNQVINGITGTA